jgi:hypothetical protein
MTQVIDGTEDRRSPLAIHFHIIPGIRDSKERRDWLCYNVFPKFIERLNEKYDVGANSAEFSNRHNAAGWTDGPLMENWRLKLGSGEDERYVSVSLKTLKLDVNGVLKIVLESVPVAGDGPPGAESRGLKCIGDELHATLRQYPDVDVLYKDVRNRY